MGLIRAVIRELRSGSLENPGNPLNPSSLTAMLGGTPTFTGRSVSADGALRYGPVWQCVNILAQSVASLPLGLYRYLERGGREPAVEHPLYTVLHSLPNPHMTSYNLRETLQGHACLWGNAYAEIVRDGRGDVRELWPLPPDRVTRHTLADGRVLYLVQVRSGEQVPLRGDQVLHLRGLGKDGRVGYGVVQMAREAIGLGLAAEEFGARFYSQDGRPGGVLKTTGTLSDSAIERLRASWEAAHTGLGNAHRVAILEEGLEWQATNLPPEAMQFLESRRFQRGEVAGWWRVPPHLLGDTEKQTSWGTGVEQQGIHFLQFTLLPILTNWEQEIARSLLRDRERSLYYARHTVNGLLRGDMQTRYAAYAVARQNGWMSADEIRALEEMNPMPDGQVYLVNGNMVPVGQAGQHAAPPPAPEGSDDADDDRRA